jgi:hypothetical protein
VRAAPGVKVASRLVASIAGVEIAAVIGVVIAVEIAAARDAVAVAAAAVVTAGVPHAAVGHAARVSPPRAALLGLAAEGGVPRWSNPLIGFARRPSQMVVGQFRSEADDQTGELMACSRVADSTLVGCPHLQLLAKDLGVMPNIGRQTLGINQHTFNRTRDAMRLNQLQ